MLSHKFNKPSSSELKHLISWKGWTQEQIYDLLYLASKIKKKPSSYARSLYGQTLIMLFQKSSTRTRVSFESGMTQLGGHAIYLHWESSNFRLSNIGYEAACLAHNASILMTRLKEHGDLQKICKASTVPVINGCCNRYHPCQILADLLTIYEDQKSLPKTSQKSLEEIKLAYIGVHNNIANSLVEIASILDIELTLVCPLIPEDIVDLDAKKNLSRKALLKESLTLKSVVKEVDYIYTDAWLDLEFFDRPEYAKIQKERVEIMLPYQVNAALIKDSKAKILHDMPIHLNYEISAEAVESPRSLIFHQAANRIHVQKAILLSLLS